MSASEESRSSFDRLRMSGEKRVMSFYVYVLRCSDGSYYVGHTDDVEQRIAAHETGAFSGYTARRRPVELVFVQDFASRDEAFQCERQVKGWSRKKKEALIRGDWEALKTLSKTHGSANVGTNADEEFVVGKK